MKFKYQKMKQEMQEQIVKYGYIRANKFFMVKYDCSIRWVQYCIASIRDYIGLVQTLVKHKRVHKHSLSVIRYFSPTKKQARKLNDSIDMENWTQIEVIRKVKIWIPT